MSYTSALDVLIRAWYQKNKNKRSHYLPPNEFKSVTAEFFSELKKHKSVQDNPNWERVIKRMEYSYDMSNTDKIKQFFEHIDLKIGGIEDVLLKARHEFAHAKGVSEMDPKPLVKMNRAFEALLNRCLLRVIGFDGLYKDYSTLGFPLRHLQEPLGGPNGDGKM